MQTELPRSLAREPVPETGLAAARSITGTTMALYNNVALLLAGSLLVYLSTVRTVGRLHPYAKLVHLSESPWAMLFTKPP
jgi:hypothetical protein